MHTLDELKKSHDEIKNGLLYKQYYKKLKNNQEKDSWERVIEAIEGIIYHYKLDPEEFNRHYQNLIKESDFNLANKQSYGFFSLIYCTNLNQLVKQLQYAAKDNEVTLIAEYQKQDDFNALFVQKLEALYDKFSGKTAGFLEGVKTRRELLGPAAEKALEQKREQEFKPIIDAKETANKADKDKINEILKDPKGSTPPLFKLPLDVLMSILVLSVDVANVQESLTALSQSLSGVQWYYPPDRSLRSFMVTGH